MTSKWRRKGKAKFLMLEGYLLRSAAWRSLVPNDRALYMELKWGYDGFNNGRIGLSVRDAADALHIGKNAVAASFVALQEKGFIDATTKGAFHVKIKRATEWLLTEYKSDVTGDLARKDFMRWAPPEKNTVLSQVRSVPPQRHSTPPRSANMGKNRFTVLSQVPTTPFLGSLGPATETHIDLPGEGRLDLPGEGRPMRGDQLDLLGWKAPVKVLAFPLSANVAKVRRTAEVLERKQGRDADAYWKRIVQPMADRLAKAGLPIDTIQREIDGFSDAVQREMQRRAWRGHGQRPGGDAA